jgi:membrane fusion protein, multidrug efflux system
MAYKSAEYGRDAARAGADLAKARWEHTRITSPINGTLDDRFPKVGEMVGPGVPVARVVNLDQVKVLLSVPERYAGLLTVGAQTSFTVNAFPGKEFGGKTRFVSATVAADNRTIPVEVYLQNPGHLLKPEMIAKVKLVQSARRTAILLEEQLIRQVDQGRYVVYIVQDNRAMQRVVGLGVRSEGRIEVTAGLAEGELVVVEGYQNLADGQHVTIVQ